MNNTIARLADAHTDTIKKLVDEGALFVVNHSGGKDSQALYAIIHALVPSEQIAVVHADLGDVEWTGVQDHIRANIEHELHIARAVYKDGSEKNLLNYVEHRGMFPSSAARWCTSDLKRGPCEKVVRALSKKTGRTTIVSCFGFRAEESPARAKRPVLELSKRNSKAGRTWYEFNPIHHITTEEVFEVIHSVGQEAHWAYASGNERLSCVFCVMGSQNDLRHGATKHPELFARYVELEQRLGHTFQNGRTLEEAAGITLDEVKKISA